MTYSSDYINMSNTNNMENTLLKRQMTQKVAKKKYQNVRELSLN